MPTHLKTLALAIALAFAACEAPSEPATTAADLGADDLGADTDTGADDLGMDADPLLPGPDADAPDAAPDLAPPDLTPEDAAPDLPTAPDLPAEPDLPSEPDLIDAPDLPDLEGVADAWVPRRWAADPAPPVTHDVDTELAAVLEREDLEGACDALASGQDDRQTRLRCGKWMFFYEHFDTVGIPRDLLVFLQKYYADSFYGRGFSALGFVPDPESAEGLPVGLVTSSRRLGELETSAFTCAACHFGRTPDGRYAVGYANQELDYGRLIATLGAPLTLSGNPNAPEVHPEIRAMLQGPVAQAKMQPLYLIDLAIVGLRLLTNAGDSQPQLDHAAQERFLRLDSGTLDFLTSPLVEDHVWTVSRILPLWNLPDADLRAQHQMEHELLSWTGVVDTLLRFLQGFVVIGDGEALEIWTPERLAPLAEYIMSLRTPPLQADLDPAQVELGARLFAWHGCTDCHDGPSGEGSALYTYEELGVDDALSRIYDPDEDGNLCCGFGEDGLRASFRVKAPRMVGVEHQTRFLHNGGVHSLEQLFCLEERRADAPFAQGSQGHSVTCEGLSTAEKRAMITYLRSL